MLCIIANNLLFFYSFNGYHYLSGSLQMVLKKLLLLLVLGGGQTSTQVTMLGDGARWIIDFF